MKKFFNFKENRTFIINILVTTLFAGFVSLLNYVFNVYLARNFSEYNFNIYNAAMGILYLIQIPAIAIQTVITKRVAQNKNFNLSDFKRRSLLQFTVVAIVLSTIFYLLRTPISNTANLPVEYMLPLTVALFSAILSPISKGFLLGFEKIFVFNLVLLLETVLKFVIGMIAIRMELDITLPILANALPALLSMIIVLPLINSKSIKESVKKISIDYRNLLLIFTTFFLINIPYTLDLVLVNPENRASYGALSLIGKIVYFAAIMIAGIMFSKLANQEEKLRKSTLIISLAFTLVTGLSISLAYYLFSNQIVDIVFGGMYTEIVPYIWIYGFAMAIYAVSYMIVNYLLIRDSFFHIPFLVLLTFLQVILFAVNNNTLQDAFNNQLIVYTVLAAFTLLSLIVMSNRNGRKKNCKE